MSVFVMPSLGADMEDGKLVEWLVKPGDAVHRGDVVAVVETQKGAIEIEIFEDGIVQSLEAELGTTLPVGAPLALIGDGTAATAPVQKPEPRPSPPPAAARQAAPAEPEPAEAKPEPEPQPEPKVAETGAVAPAKPVAAVPEPPAAPAPPAPAVKAAPVRCLGPRGRIARRAGFGGGEGDRSRRCHRLLAGRGNCPGRCRARCGAAGGSARNRPGSASQTGERL
jgi:pyruvate dehydrogenase E2 component (dihydrolipoamide acetyltransferase)